MGFGGSAGRLVELGERERRAQFEAARALLPFAMAMAVRKASSAGAGLAGSRLSRISPRMRWSSASKCQCSPCVRDVASASSMRSSAASRHRRLGFELGQRDLEERVVHDCSATTYAASACRSISTLAARSPSRALRPAVEKLAECARYSADHAPGRIDEGFAARWRPRAVTAHHLEHRRVKSSNERLRRRHERVSSRARRRRLRSAPAPVRLAQSHDANAR